MGNTNEVPTLNEEKIGQSVSVIPANYWQLNCWTFREEVQNIFSFPLLSMIQRVYFTHLYYLHQI